MTLKDAYAQNIKHLFSSKNNSPLFRPVFSFWTNFHLDVFFETDNTASYAACLFTAALKLAVWGMCYVIGIMIFIAVLPIFLGWYFIVQTPYSIVCVKKRCKKNGTLDAERFTWTFGPKENET